ncbi:hypothetical protein [Quadrisphaera sp. DSM 44207]|nr:hypothetical protein [Quadrisphaera sp. DSM 44207]SDQ78176.1 hypothetical protein SAMN05428996_2783 [Quadrisphaera sp. DSM 44207]
MSDPNGPEQTSPDADEQQGGLPKPVLTTDEEAQRDDLPVRPENS